jgi:DNA-binding CsgD family transcriptional regulator
LLKQWAEKGIMKAGIPEMLRTREAGADVLEALAASNTPALATDAAGHVIFWNRAAERLLGRPAGQALGRRCYDLLAGRDVFGNRFCHQNCAVLSMLSKGESVRGFELSVASGPRAETLQVTILDVPGARPELTTIVHIFQPFDAQDRLALALERLGASKHENPLLNHGSTPPGPAFVPNRIPALTDREREVFQLIAAGLSNKEVAQKAGISVATARNHIHNILAKLDVHSKLEAVSLAFRQGWVALASER